MTTITTKGHITTIDNMAHYLAESAIRNKHHMRPNGEDSMSIIVGDVLTSDTTTGYNAFHLEADIAQLIWGHPDGDLNVPIFDDDGVLDPMRIKRARKAEALEAYIRNRLTTWRNDPDVAAWREAHGT